MFNEIHEFDALFGQELRSVDRNSNNFTSYGIQYNKGLTAFTDPRILEKLINGGESYFGFNEERERTVGFFGKVGYTYDRRYTVPNYSRGKSGRVINLTGSDSCTGLFSYNQLK